MDNGLGSKIQLIHSLNMNSIGMFTKFYEFYRHILQHQHQAMAIAYEIMLSLKEIFGD